MHKKIFNLFIVLCVLFFMPRAWANVHSSARIGIFPSNIFDTSPTKSLLYFNFVFLNQVGQTLVSEDRAGALIPSIAKLWNISPNRLVYTFHLRHDIRFQDGTPLTAKDVIYSINQSLYSSGSAGSLYLKSISGYSEGKSSRRCPGIKALDAYTVRITLAKPYTPLMRLLASGALIIYHKETGKRRHHILIGSGPYKIVHSKTGQYFLKAYAGYKGPYPPHIKRINLIANSRLILPRSPLPKDERPDMDFSILNEARLKSYPKSKYILSRHMAIESRAFYLHPDGSQNRMDRKFRFQVLNIFKHAIDKMKAESKLNMKLTDVFPFGMFGHEENRTSYLNLIRKINATAPVPVGRSIRFAHVGPESPLVKKLCRIIESDFHQDVIPVQIHYNNVGPELKHGRYDIILMSFKSVFLDPDTSFTAFDLVRTQNLLKNPAKFNRLRIEASEALLDKKRLALYRQLADIIFNERLYLPYFQAITIQAVRKGFSYNRTSFKYTPNFSDLK